MRRIMNLKNYIHIIFQYYKRYIFLLFRVNIQIIIKFFIIKNVKKPEIINLILYKL